MRIYLIDDDYLSLFLTQNVLALEDAPHDVTTFLSAQEALEALHAGNDDDIPELILLDLNMPTWMAGSFWMHWHRFRQRSLEDAASMS